MKSLYKPATTEQPGECLNIMPTRDGSIEVIGATKDAVIVQLFISYDEEGRRKVDRVVSIECTNSELYPDLRKEALRILRENP